MKKGMAFFAIIALIIGAIVIIIAGPVAVQKGISVVNKQWNLFEPKESQESTTQTSTGSNIRAIGTRSEVLAKIVSELNTCWQRMRRDSIQNYKCSTIEVAYTGEDKIPSPSSEVPVNPQNARGPLHRTEIVNALELRDEDAATQLDDDWNGADATYWAYLDRGTYLICADYDAGDLTGDDIWLTKNLAWDCEG